MQKQRLRERLPKCISAAKFGPRFRADTLTFLLSLWKPGVPGIEVYFENESTPSRAFGKYTWYRATRCGVNPKSNRSAVKFRARARYMQWVLGTGWTWKESDVEDATRRVKDECRRKRADRKTNGGDVKGEDSGRSIPEGAGYQCGRLQCSLLPLSRTRDATIFVFGKTARWQRAFIAPADAKSSIYIPRENAARVVKGAVKKDADAICKTRQSKGRAMIIKEVKREKAAAAEE